MSRPDSWLPLYVADYKTDTARLSTEQHGAYLLILMDYWRSGPPPNDDRVLAQITGLPIGRWKSHRPTIQAFFSITAGVWRQKRIDAEIEKAQKKSDQARDAANRRHGNSDADAHADAHAGNGAEPHAELHAKAVRKTCSSPSPSQELLPAPAPSPPPKQPSAAPKTGAPDAGKTVGTWNAYCSAYTERYTVKPLRNAKVNGQLAKLVDQLGSEEAPKVAEFYLTHNGGLYVSSGHCVDLLLRDCGKLRTEMVTGHRITRLESRNAEAGDALRAQVDRVGMILEGSKS